MARKRANPRSAAQPPVAAAFERRVLATTEDCLALPEAERSLRLARLAEEDQALATAVRRLIARDATAPAWMPGEGRVLDAATIDHLPERIGPFRVTGKLGEGGMGVVLKAERDDGLFAQTVAIKLMRPGIAAFHHEARFMLERQILARLDSPAICRILDGGVWEGRPWLSMDWVDGVPLTRHADARGLDTAQRIALFEQVCAAVQYAHRRLVIHADLKPSNILVTSEGAVKLLDFGIGRIVEEERDRAGGESTTLTRAYAAPERHAGQAPTVAGDVYSLGAILYELLTGSVAGSPFGARATRTGTIAPHEPAPGGPALPEPALPEPAPNQPGPGGSAARGALPAHDWPRASAAVADAAAARLLLGDIDAIVAKALAHEPAARYADVGALLADLAAWRRHYPVTARPVGRAGRIGRFVRRHVRGLALTGAIGAVLVAATAVSVIEARRAQARFGQVRELSHFLLFDLYDTLARQPGTVAQRAAIAARTSAYLDGLRVANDAPADLRLETAEAYRRLAAIEGLSGTASLGDPAAAKAALARAEMLADGVLAADPQNAAAQATKGWAMLDRWTLLSNTADSIALNLAARRHFDAALHAAPRDAGALLGRLTTAKNEAFDLIGTSDQPAAAIPVLTAALAQLHALAVPPAWADRAAGLDYLLTSKLGDAFYHTDKIAAALEYYGRAREIVDRALAARPGDPVWLARKGEVLWNVSGSLEDLPGRKAEALADAEAGIAAERAVLALGPDANAEKKLAILYGQAANLHADLHQPAPALASAAQSLAIRQRRLAAAPADPARLRDIAIGQMNAAQVAEAVGQHGAACRAAAEAMATWNALAARGQLGPHDRAKNMAQIGAFGARCR